MPSPPSVIETDWSVEGVSDSETDDKAENDVDGDDGDDANEKEYVPASAAEAYDLELGKRLAGLLFGDLFTPRLVSPVTMVGLGVVVGYLLPSRLTVMVILVATLSGGLLGRIAMIGSIRIVSRSRLVLIGFTVGVVGFLILIGSMIGHALVHCGF